MELSYKSNTYATHQPVLIEILKNTTGNILELGCGDGSTNLFRNFLSNERKLYSIESNLEWYNKYKHLENNNHKLLYVNASNEDTDETGNKWTSFLEQNVKDIKFEIVFIDQSPWTARTHSLNYYKDKAKYIIVHDVDYFPFNNKFGKILSEYKTQEGYVKCEFDFSDIVKQFYVFYPPFKYYTYYSGIPTLITSDIATELEFKSLINIIEKNYSNYYS